MNSYLNIQVRVITADAIARMRAMEAQAAGTTARMNGMGTATGGIRGALVEASRGMARFGNQVQWAGRQLQYNFSLPIAIAAGAASKFALDNEKAMVRVRKVYGDLSMDAGIMKREIEALEGAFVALSNHYGVHQKAVIDIAGSWAAAGASGVALAKGTELTLRAMVLGEMEAVEATTALIAIQSQYKLSTEGLGDTLAQLNIIENQTGISMQGLIEGFTRSAGAARSAGVDTRHLGAMLAALTPASGSATTAGNALKTMISRLLSPTREAAEVLELMGININDAAWKSSDGAKRLEHLAKSYMELDTSQRAVVSSTIASRWQINRFDVLMESMVDEAGYYHKSLDATADKSMYLAQAQKELNTVLESNPQRLKQLWVMLQNAMADIVQPLIPLILMLANMIVNLVNKFQALDPAVQKFIGVGLLLLAAFGPIIRYFGSTITLLAYLSMSFHVVAGAAATAGKAIAWLFLMPWKAIAAPILLIGKGFASLGAAALGALAPLGKLGGIFAAIGPAMGKALSGSGKFLAGGLTSMLASVIAFATSSLVTLARVMVTGIVALGAVIGPALVTAWAIGYNLLLKSYIAFQFMILRATAVMGPMLRYAWLAVWAGVYAVQGAIYTGGLALYSGYLAAINAVTVIWGKGFPALWAMVLATITGIQMAWGLVMQGIFAAELLVMRGALLFWTGGITAIWLAMDKAILAIRAAFGPLILGATAAIHAGLTALTVGFRSLMLSLWAVMYTSILALTVTFRTMLPALWVTIQTALTGVVAAMGAAIVGIWRATLAAMSSATVLMAAFTKIGAAFVALGTMIVTIVSAIGPALIAVFTSPWTLAIAAVVGLVYAFRDELVAAWDVVVQFFQGVGQNLGQSMSGITGVFNSAISWIHEAFWSLPQGVHDAMSSVVQVVADAAMAVYEWFSYLNPFARHSPSLVDNVTNGMAAVRAEFGTVGAIRGPIEQAYATLKKFGAATAELMQNMDSAERLKALKDLQLVAPGSVELFKSLVAQLKQLRVTADNITASITRQEAVVKRWKTALDAAGKAVQDQRDKLNAAKDALSGYEDALAEATQRAQDFAKAPLKGMGAMDDAIFENEQAQKRLRLEMLKMEQAGGEYEDVSDKVNKLAGEIELLSGKQSELRNAGAGREITELYDKQIAAARKAQKDLQKGGGGEGGNPEYERMKKQLEELQKAAERLDLERALEFDGPRRELEKMVNDQKELTFEEAVRGVKEAQRDMEKYGKLVDQAAEKVKAEEEELRKVEAAHEAIQKRYDAEQEKLTGLKDSYDAVNAAIREMQTSLTDAGQAAADMIRRQEEAARKAAAAAKKRADAAKKTAKSAKGKTASAKERVWSPAAENFLAAEGGNYDIPGGGLGVAIGREQLDIADQTDLINQFTQDLAKDTAGMFEEFDVFEPLRTMWDKFKQWFFDNVTPVFAPLTGIFDKVDFGDLGDQLGDIGGSVTDKLKGASDAVKGFFDDAVSLAQGYWETLKSWGSSLWGLFGDDLTSMWETLGTKVSGFWDKVGPTIGSFWDALKGLGTMFKEVIWPAVVTVAKILGGALLGALKIVTSVLANVLGPAIDIIIGIFNGFIGIVTGVVNVIVGIFTGDLGLAIDGVKTIFSSTFNAIVDIIVGFGGIVWGIIKGIVDGIVGFFTWLWDILVGHSIIPDMINAIVEWFDWMMTPIQIVLDWFGDVFDKVKELWDIAWKATKKMVATLWDGIKKNLQGAYNWLKDTFGLILDVVKKAWSKSWDAVKKLVSDSWDKTKKNFTTAYNWLRDTFGLILDVVKAAWGKSWDFIKSQASDKWTNVKKNFSTAYNWLKDTFGNILNKVKETWSASWDKVKSQVDDKWKLVKAKFTKVKDWMTNVFGKIMDDVKEAWKTAWNKLGEWFEGAKSKLTSPLKSAVNIAIDAVNSLIKGLNKVANVLPGLDWEISLVPKLATGGNIPKRRVGNGFKTSGARAIVGEGKANYPEYVIPTDPTHRARAKSLYASLGRQIGVDGQNYTTLPNNGLAKKTRSNTDAYVPGYFMGGIIGAIGDKIGGAKDFAAGIIEKGIDIAKNLPTMLIKPFIATTNSWIEKINYDKAEDVIKAGRDEVLRWAGFADDVVQDKYDKGSEGMIGGGSLPKKGRSTWVAQWAELKSAFPNAQLYSAYRAGARTRSGYVSLHSQGRAIDVTPSMEIFNWIKSKYGRNSQEVYYSPAGDGQIQGGKLYNTKGTPAYADHFDHVHWGYDSGGYLQPGMSSVFNGTGKPEAVFTDKQWSTLRGLVVVGANAQKIRVDRRVDPVVPHIRYATLSIDRVTVRAERVDVYKNHGRLIGPGEMHYGTDPVSPTTHQNTFTGNLVFPNITSPDDAEQFMKNLEAL